MSGHVHWLLLALSFLVGLVFTYALLALPARHQVPRNKRLRQPVRRAPEKSAPREASATRIAGGRLASTTKIPVTEKTTKIPVTEKTTKIPVTEKTTKIPVTERTTRIPLDTTRKITANPNAPYGDGSARGEPGGNGPRD